MSVSYKDVASAEQLGIQKVVEDSLGLWLVLDKISEDEDYSDQLLLIPFSWDHRRLINRNELPS